MNMGKLALRKKNCLVTERKKKLLDYFLVTIMTTAQESTSFLIIFFSYRNIKYQLSEQGEFLKKKIVSLKKKKKLLKNKEFEPQR